MPKFRLMIVQYYKVRRETVIDVEADDIGQAVDQTDEAPDFEDKRWSDVWDLQSEDVFPAGTNSHA